MKCSARGCEKPPAVQWVQLLGDEAESAHLDRLHSQLAELAEDKRRGIRFRIASLQDAKEDPPKSLSPADLLAFQDRADQQIAAAQKEHDAVPTTFNLEHHRGSYQTRASCEEHQVHDPEWYSVPHAADCDDSEGCGCS